MRDPRSLAHDIMAYEGVADPVELLKRVKQYCDFTLENIGKNINCIKYTVLGCPRSEPKCVRCQIEKIQISHCLSLDKTS